VPDAKCWLSAFTAPASRDDDFRVYTKQSWDQLSERLFQMAGEVAKALAKE
jgi:hypothetical protein